MNVADLIAEFRDESDDVVAPYLWKDEMLVRYANDAQMEAAVRSRFFIDTAGKLGTVVVKAGTGIATLDPRIIYVRRARVDGRDLLLLPTYLRDMACWPGWESETGEPCRFIKDFSSGKLRVHPKPLVDTTLVLTFTRGPLDDLDANADLEIPLRYQRQLVYWMLHRAYSKRDSGGDARDDKLAVYYEKKFDEVFGPRRSALDEVFEQQQEDVYPLQDGSW